MPHASGPFDVQLSPQAQDSAEGTTLGRMTIDKQLHGDLQATGKGEMLSARMDSGSAAYVALERISGVLHGRSGSFVLQHNGLLTPGSQQLTITVVPNSGTGALAGIAGTLAIRIVDGAHFYDFDYTLED